MTQERFDYLQAESRAERLSYAELAEIQDSFEHVPDSQLADLREHALADDMLWEIAAFYDLNTKS